MGHEESIESQGIWLCTFARFVICQHLNLSVDSKLEEDVEKKLALPLFSQHRGVFVTLHHDGNLRGCIGSLEARESIRDGVRRHALNAAFQDYRFSPLSVEEVEAIDIEVSILTKPKPLVYDTTEELLEKLIPFQDGVVLHKGGRGATFLPQVWQQLPVPDIFLSHLCGKAGLSTDAWRDGAADIETYRVLLFSESKNERDLGPF